MRVKFCRGLQNETPAAIPTPRSILSTHPKNLVPEMAECMIFFSKLTRRLIAELAWDNGIGIL